MLKMCYFKIIRTTPGQPALAIEAPLKRLQIYDRETSISFFYSEIEECWLVQLNSGCCRINNRMVYSTSENLIVVEKSVNIVLSGISFTFFNQSSSRGISKQLAHILLKRKKFKLKTGDVLEMIRDNCEYYKDFYFVLDAIRKNEMFGYRCGEIALNIETLHGGLIGGCSPILGSLKYEIENGFFKDQLKSFNISKMWYSGEFVSTDFIVKPQGMLWPTPAYLQCLLKSTEMIPIEESRKELLPSPRSSCRYINPYKVGIPSGIVNKPEDDKVESDTSSTNSLDQQRDIQWDGQQDDRKASDIPRDDSSTSDGSLSGEGLMASGKRRRTSGTEKRFRYNFKLELEPTIEKLRISCDSDHSTSTNTSDFIPTTVHRVGEIFVKSASCVEDGFLCERLMDGFYDSSMRDRKERKHGSVLARYKDYKVLRD